MIRYESTSCCIVAALVLACLGILRQRDYHALGNFLHGAIHIEDYQTSADMDLPPAPLLT